MIDGLIAWAMTSLEAPDTGLNAVRLTVPRDEDAEVPPEARIYSENESAWVARGVVPQELLTKGPIFIVRQAEEFEMPFLPERSEPGTVDLAIVGAARGDASHTELLQLRQLLRSSLRSIALALDTLPGATPQIVARGCAYEPTGRVVWLPAVLSPDTPLLAGVVLSFRIEDPWSQGGAPVT